MSDDHTDCLFVGGPANNRIIRVRKNTPRYWVPIYTQILSLGIQFDPEPSFAVAVYIRSSSNFNEFRYSWTDDE